MSGGRRRYESTKSTLKQDAQRLLTLRLGDTEKGIVINPKVGRITLGATLKAVIDNLKMNGRKGVAHTQQRIDSHILYRPPTPETPAIGYFHVDRRLNTITTSDLTAFTAHRLDEGAAAASVNHELAIIRRAFRLALRAGEIASAPQIPMLKVSNTRQGFLEREQFEAILAHLPAYLHAPLTFMFVTGWRKSEVFSLTAAQVDLRANVVRLEPGTTKNGEGRTICLTETLRALLQQQLTSIDVLRRQGIITPYVFHRDDGSQIKDFRKRWETACERAGYRRILHDFRRTAVRNLERAGVPRSTAMKMVGHKTESIYRRYALQDEAMLREAAAKQDAWAQSQQPDPENRGAQVKQFASKR